MYPGEAFLRAVITESALQEEFNRNGLTGEKRRVQAWFQGTRPLAKYAWEIGDALRLRGLLGASGLAALWIFDYLGDAAAILAAINEQTLAAHRGALIAMIAVSSLLGQLSPYDVLSQNHRVLNGEADDWTLQQLADTEAVRPDSTNFEAEANFLNGRFFSWRIWQMSDELTSLLNDAARSWFSSRKEQREKLIAAYPRELRAAYYVGTASPMKVPISERYFTVQNLLVSWLAQIRQPTTDEAIAFATNTLGPDAPAARAFNSIIQCATHVAEAIHGVRIETDDLTLVRLISAYVDARVGESFGFTYGVIERAMRDASTGTVSE